VVFFGKRKVSLSSGIRIIGAPELPKVMLTISFFLCFNHFEIRKVSRLGTLSG